MPRFVLLDHDHPAPHLDLLLEDADDCRAWRLWGDATNGDGAPAEPLPPHRKHYLTYEGPVSGARGHVQRRDAGTYEEAGDVLRLSGRTLRGDFEFVGGRFRPVARIVDAASNDRASDRSP